MTQFGPPDGPDQRPRGRWRSSESSRYQGLARIAHDREAERAMAEVVSFVDVGSGRESRAIAVRALAGARPGLFWLSGLKSDMQGTKAGALARFAAEHGRALVRFDYSGHGESKGEFADGTIGRWLEEKIGRAHV